LADFQVIMYGRFWVITEDLSDLLATVGAGIGGKYNQPLNSPVFDPSYGDWGGHFFLLGLVASVIFHSQPATQEKTRGELVRGVSKYSLFVSKKYPIFSTLEGYFFDGK
jgi:hypothetical protein